MQPYVCAVPAVALGANPAILSLRQESLEALSCKQLFRVLYQLRSNAARCALAPALGPLFCQLRTMLWLREEVAPSTCTLESGVPPKSLGVR